MRTSGGDRGMNASRRWDSADAPATPYPRSAAGLHQRIYEIVKQIPYGRVASYGRIARMVNCTARQVGYALSASTDDIPWQRVINAKGEISIRAGAERQRRKLMDEGILFDTDGRVDFEKFGWRAAADDELL